MIIFDLCETLACSKHRRHFIEKPWDMCIKCYDLLTSDIKDKNCECGRNPFTWKEDLESFKENCIGDKPIAPVLDLIESLLLNPDEVKIWTGRYESQKEKTIEWLSYQIPMTIRWGKGKWENHLKMRPIADDSPEHELKEKWLDELNKNDPKNKIDFVFESDKKSIKMWRKRGIFVFDCNQENEDY